MEIIADNNGKTVYDEMVVVDTLANNSYGTSSASLFILSIPT